MRHVRRVIPLSQFLFEGTMEIDTRLCRCRNDTSADIAIYELQYFLYATGHVTRRLKSRVFLEVAFSSLGIEENDFLQVMAIPVWT